DAVAEWASSPRRRAGAGTLPARTSAALLHLDAAHHGRVGAADARWYAGTALGGAGRVALDRFVAGDRTAQPRERRRIGSTDAAAASHGHARRHRCAAYRSARLRQHNP